MRSPVFNGARPESRTPFTIVPFLLPRSRIAQPSPSRSMQRCCRESPPSSGKLSSAAADRPSDSRSPSSGTLRLLPSGERIWSSFICAFVFCIMHRSTLQGRIAVITGASKGLGRAMALALAEQGARVALVARGSDALDALVGQIQASGGDAEAFVADA